MANEEKHSSKLLVEGPTDMHVVLALCNDYNVTENFDIIVCDGIDKLLINLKMRLSNPQINRTIGIMVDADNDISNRFSKIVDILNHNNKSNSKINQCLTEKGLIIPSEDTDIFPNIGVWLMPDNVNLGMIEDFAISLIPENDNIVEEVDAELKKIEDMGINRYASVHHSKAKIHTFLSWQKEPGSPIGQSITKNVLNPKNEIARTYIGWVQKLFAI